MQIQIEDLARQKLIDIYYYNSHYSLKNAIETNIKIFEQLNNLKLFPYIGKVINKIPNDRFRELIINKNSNSYRILYYISEKNKTIYIIYILNCRQDFNQILKSYNYFQNYYDL